MAPVRWLWNGDHWNLSGRSCWSRRPVARPGAGLVRERLQGELGGRSLERRSAPLPLQGLSQSLRRVQPLRLTGAARAVVGGVAAAAPARAASAGSQPRPSGTRGQGAGAGAGGAPEGPLRAPRPLLEDVSGKAHVLPAGAEQDNLGGARALPEPVPGGLRSLWLRVVSVTGPGAVVAGWPFVPRSQACPRAQRCTKRQEFSLVEGTAAPSSPVQHSLCPLHASPCTPGRGQLCAVRGGAAARPAPAPCASPAWGLLLRGQAPREALSGALSAGVQQKDPLRRCAHPGLQSPPQGQRSPGSCREK